MKTLVIFELERRIQPFIQFEIAVAVNLFDKVILITNQLNKQTPRTFTYANLEHIEINKTIKLIGMIRTCLFGLFSGRVIKQMIEAIHDSCFDLQYIKHLMTLRYQEWCLCHSVRSIMSEPDHDIYLLATWFAGEACAAAELKKRFPKIYAISLAHSFEIDPVKTKYVDFSFNKFKHQYLDRVSFISRTMKDIYSRTTGYRYSEYDDKCDVTYLGSIKNIDTLNNLTESDTFRLVSCSSVIPVKKVETIVNILSYWKHSRVEWIHFGDGILMDDIQHQIEEVAKENPLVSFRLMGRVSNEIVQDYYASKRVDLFINVSETEGIPVSIMEAMSYGIPALATDVGGTGELVKKDTGFLVAYGTDPEVLYNKIKEYQSSSIERQQLLRHNAYEYWKKWFNARNNMYDWQKSIIEKM